MGKRSFQYPIGVSRFLSFPRCDIMHNAPAQLNAVYFNCATLLHSYISSSFSASCSSAFITCVLIHILNINRILILLILIIVVFSISISIGITISIIITTTMVVVITKNMSNAWTYYGVFQTDALSRVCRCIKCNNTDDCVIFNCVTAVMY